jgi:peptide/nickel transport system substrate-binding protein
MGRESTMLQIKVVPIVPLTVVLCMFVAGCSGGPATTTTPPLAPTSAAPAPTTPPSQPTAPPTAAPQPVTPAPANTVAPTAAAASAVTRANTLIIATPQDVVSLDPPVGGNDISSEIDWQMYEMTNNFVFVNQNGALVQQGDKTEPWLAENIDVSPDARTITYHLRKAVKFYPSGNEMTAKDLDWVVQRMLQMKAGYGKFTLEDASIVKPGQVVDDYTYQITLDQANPAARPVLALIDNAIIDSVEAKKHATDADPWADEYLKRNSLGTGPYYLSSLKPGQEFVLDAVPNYWRQPPFFKRIVYRIVPDPSSRLTLLRSGDVDIAQKLPGEQLDSLQGVTGLAVLSGPSSKAAAMFMNTQMGPTADINVRKAIAWALPYDDILAVAFRSAGKRHDSLFSPNSLGYLPGPGYSQDIEKAKQLLTASGSPNGFNVSLAIDSAVSEHEQAAILVQTALEKLNISVNIVKKPTAQFRTDLNARQNQLVIHNPSHWIDEGTYLITFSLTPNGTSNYSGVNIPEINQILPAMYTADVATRKAGYERIQTLWNEQVPDVIFAQLDQQVALTSNIHNFVFSYTSLPQYYPMSRS